MGVELDEMRQTVMHMEARLGCAEDILARELMAAYQALMPRFAADLGDERDELLTRGGALMLVQKMLRRRSA